MFAITDPGQLRVWDLLNIVSTAPAACGTRSRRRSVSGRPSTRRQSSDRHSWVPQAPDGWFDGQVDAGTIMVERDVFNGRCSPSFPWLLTETRRTREDVEKGAGANER